MRNEILNFIILFMLQLWTYAVACISYRTVAQAEIGKSVAIDVVFAAVNFFVIKRVAKDEGSWWGFAGYTMGSATGTAVGILLSLAWLGK